MAAANSAADAAGAVIRRSFRNPLAVEQKSDDSPVTQVDWAAEQAMREAIARHCPGHAVLGEEMGSHAGASGAQAGLRWVIDPIDGTRAFITGRPTFGTLVALLEDDVPILGLIDQPITGERWLGVAGRPTLFRGPFGGTVGCRPCADLASAELSCTSPDVFGPDRARWERLRARVRRTSFGGDCYAYGLLALGHIDVIAEATMQPWDWAALVPVITGAGGMVTDWGGRALTPDGDGRVLAAGSAALLAQAVAALAD